MGHKCRIPILLINNEYREIYYDYNQLHIKYKQLIIYNTVR